MVLTAVIARSASDEAIRTAAAAGAVWVPAFARTTLRL
jgi:pyruvoyl-dependent arginine decarboxylase (PvlArgDC)